MERDVVYGRVERYLLYNKVESKEPTGGYKKL